MKEDKSGNVFNEFNDRELLLNYRINLEKAKQLANSANSRSQDAARDIRNMEEALVASLDKIDAAVKRFDIAVKTVMEYLNMPWYKRIFYSRKK